MASKRLIFRHAIVSLSFVLVYLLLNRPEVIFISRIGFVAWYPAVGIVIALLLDISPWYPVLVFLADRLTGKIMYAQPVMSFSGTVGSLGSALCYGAAACVLRRSLRIDLGLRRRWDVVRYVLLSVTAAVGAAIVGVGCLIADHSIALSEYKSSGLGWFLGDAIGLVGIAPFFLIHVFPRVRSWLSPTFSETGRPVGAGSTHPKFKLTEIVEASGQALTIFAVLLVIFGFRDARYDRFYLCFIPIIWIAIRQGIRRIATGLLAMNLGMVVAMDLFPPTAVLFTKVALVMFVLSIVGLIVGSEVSERYRLVIDLDRQTTYLDSLIQNSPLGIIVLDRQGAVELANSAFEKLFQCDRDQLASIDIGRLGASEEEASDSTELIRQVFAGKALRKTIRRQQRDGRPLEL